MYSVNLIFWEKSRNAQPNPHACVCHIVSNTQLCLSDWVLCKTITTLVYLGETDSTFSLLLLFIEFVM